IIAQTTLSQEEIAEALHRIHQDFPEAKLLKGTCLSTTERQEAIKRLPEDVDVLIVLGSSSSNNSKKLAEIGAKRGLDTHLVLGLDELKRIRFDGKKKVALSSGASTSPKTYDLCCDYLLSL
ncbi:MAG: hypothetical protein HUJ60_01580, partial [Bacilli bacterium]|nr:hypothetical protein [Bacilli bacterium]